MSCSEKVALDASQPENANLPVCETSILNLMNNFQIYNKTISAQIQTS